MKFYGDTGTYIYFLIAAALISAELHICGQKFDQISIISILYST